MPNVALILPARDEEGSVGPVVESFESATWPDGVAILDEVVVTDNNSRDRTADVARAAGATVVFEPKAGYGNACLRAMQHLRSRASGPPEIVVFADADGSNDAGDLGRLVHPVARGYADMVIGTRARHSDPGALTIPQRFGNELAVRMMRVTHRVHYSDLGPFRAIRWKSLEALGMADPTYGWTVEMQIKAVKAGLKIREVDVKNHLRTAGDSKVSGTVKGVVGAGTKIIGMILRHW